jgi:hypothetical protein
MCVSCIVYLMLMCPAERVIVYVLSPIGEYYSRREMFDGVRSFSILYLCFIASFSTVVV